MLLSFNHLNLILHILPNPHRHGGLLKCCFTTNGIKASAGVRNGPRIHVGVKIDPRKPFTWLFLGTLSKVNLFTLLAPKIGETDTFEGFFLFSLQSTIVNFTLQLEPDILPLWWKQDGLRNMKKSDENYWVHYEISAQNVNYHD